MHLSKIIGTYRRGRLMRIVRGRNDADMSELVLNRYRSTVFSRTSLGQTVAAGQATCA